MSQQNIRLAPWREASGPRSHERKAKLSRVPHTQEWELYHNSFSLCSKKVRVCMEELDLPYAAHHVHLIETCCYETLSPQFLEVNPKGTVPILIHRGQRIFESHAQIAYAEKHRGGGSPGLSPSDPALRAMERTWVDRASLVGDRVFASANMRAHAGNCVGVLTLPLFATMVQNIPHREIAKGLATHPNKERPLLFLAMKQLGVRRLPWLRPIMRILRRARTHLERHLDALAAQLDAHAGPWICDEMFTLADVSWVVLLDRLAEADWDDFFWGAARRPTVAQYWQRLQARPSVRHQLADARVEITSEGIAALKRAKREDARLRHALEGR